MALTLIRSGDHDGADAQLRTLAPRKRTEKVRISLQPRVLFHDAERDRSRYTWWRGVNWTYEMDPADTLEFRLLLADVFSRVSAYGMREVRDRLTIALPLRAK